LVGVTGCPVAAVTTEEIVISLRGWVTVTIDSAYSLDLARDAALILAVPGARARTTPV
jgi:hypothetical protein